MQKIWSPINVMGYVSWPKNTLNLFCDFNQLKG